MKGIPLPKRTEDFTADPVELVGGSVAGVVLLVTVDVLMALTFALEIHRIER